MRVLSHLYRQLVSVIATCMCALVCANGMPYSSIAQAAPQRLVFSTHDREPNEDAGISEIYRINADGSGMAAITPEPISGYIYALAASPDSSKIAFLLNPSRFANSIMVYTINADGTDLQAIVPDSDGRVYTSVLWSPDGSQLLLQINNGGPNALSLINADGSDLHTLRQFRVGLPITVTEWAADGRFFAYDSMGGILWVNPDGTERTAIATIGAMFFQPFAVPSPDLTQIAFTTYDPEEVLHITGINGENEQTFSGIAPEDTPNQDISVLRWSPDGSMLAYTASVELGYNNLMVINVDGTGRAQLTPLTLQVTGFDWLPVPESA